MKLIMLVGPAGSGKTTYRHNLANELVKNCTPDVPNECVSFISQDDHGKGHLELFKMAIECENKYIIVDRMNFDKAQRNRYLEPARKAGYEIEIVVFHVPRETCFQRIMARENHPTINGLKMIDVCGSILPDLLEKTKQANSALDTFFTKYERVEDTEADKVTRIGWDGPKPDCVIFDIDGTMANIEHRLHHVKHEIKKHNRWDLFNKEIDKDSVNDWCKMLYLNTPANVRRVFCSGRVDSLRAETHKWLLRNVDGEYDNLFMRHRSDFRQDYIIKEIILDFELLPRYNVLFAIDDRSQVVEMWRRRGLVCLQCAEGKF